MSLRNALLLSAIGLAWTVPAFGQGCQHDMQCKGDRICNQGVCMAADADGSDSPAASGSSSTSSGSSAPASKPLPTIRLSPKPAPQASPAPSPVSPQSPPSQVQPQPAPQPASPPPAQMSPQHQAQGAQQQVSVPQSCCTVAGKLRMAPLQSGDAPLMAGDSCRGFTNSGKPVPGIVCN